VLSDTQQLVRSLFKDDSGNPIILSDGQDEIFTAIATKIANRLHIECHTRFGKTFVAGLAVLIRVCTFPEKWAIVAGTKEKAHLIMSVIESHIFDNPFTLSRYLPDKGESIDELKRFRNKSHLTFKLPPAQPGGPARFSEVIVGSAKDALGSGAPNILLDEAALVPDDEFSLVLRMLGDNPEENFLAKIGNPFTRGHFLKSFNDPAYQKIIWDCYRSLAEGVRINQATIDENRPYSYFKVLFECQFPSASEVDESGWMYLILDNEIVTSQARNNQGRGPRRLGLDVARGGRNYNCWVLRTDTTAEVIDKDLSPDLIATGDKTINIMRDHSITPGEVYVDDSGVGGGVTDYLKSRGVAVNPVNFGESAEEKGEFLNVRSEIYTGKDGLAVWVRTGGQLLPHKDWLQLTEIRYRKESSGKVKLESKEDMRKRGVESPDVADALALTFAKSKKVIYYKMNPETVLSGHKVKPLYPGWPG
jgi:hypothetical protein